MPRLNPAPSVPRAPAREVGPARQLAARRCYRQGARLIWLGLLLIAMLSPACIPADRQTQAAIRPTLGSAPPETESVPAEPAPRVPAAAAMTPLPTLRLAEPSPAPLATDSTARAVFSGDRARADVVALSESIGSRVAGGSAQAQASAYIRGELAGAGWTTDLQRFTYSVPDDRGSTLDITAPRTLAPAISALNGSPSGRVSGRLVSVGLAREGDFDPARVHGQVALARRGEIRFSEKLANVAAAGATGLLVYNNLPGRFNGSLTGPGQLPCAGLSDEDGELLLQVLDQGPVNVDLRVDVRQVERSAANVVASRPHPGPTVIIGAHSDSVADGPGANDNASGVAVLLELARATADRSYPFNLTLVTFDAEEVGLFGSKEYVRQLGSRSGPPILAMINLDMVGVGDRLAFGGDARLIERALDHATLLGQATARLSEPAGSGSDHASFQAAGIRTIFVNRTRDPRYHTANDRAEFVTAENLDAAGKLVDLLLDDLAAELRPGQ